MKSIFCLAALCAILTLQSQPLELQLVPFATAVNNPVDIANAGDERLFVVEQGGKIRIVRPDGSVDPVSFLDLSSLTNGSGERGLLGLAFHPNYAENGFLYVNFTDNSGGDTQISRFTVTSDPDVADFSSRLDIIEIDQTAGNHNGGCLRFGPDGFLYIGMGDGGGAGDQPNNAQNINLLLGKMVRINVDGAQPYSIPNDNPFIGQGPLDEIWAIGLRNPWKFSFDSETGDMWIGDVGQSDLEEVDFEPANGSGGINYGWRCYEGTDVYNFAGCAGGSYTDPVSEYSHAGGACSITGGLVYRGENNLDMQGRYFAVDYCSGVFRSVRPDGVGGWITEVISASQGGFGWTSFGVDSSKELYAANKNTDVVYRVIDSDCVGYSATFSADGTSLTASGGESYQWYLDGSAIPEATAQMHEAAVTGQYSVRVANSEGCSSLSAQAEVMADSGCQGDINGDEAVDINDVLSFNSAFGQICEACPEDLDQNGSVDVNDFLILNSTFGQSCQ